MNDRPDERAYKIQIPERNHHGTAYVDGGYGQEPFGDILLETKDRLGSVESEIESHHRTLSRIECKIDDVSESVAAVDDASLSEDHFDQHFRGKINKNRQITRIVVWGGSVALAILGMITTLVAATGGL